MATPAERASWILAISASLDEKSWTDEEMLLNEFRLPRFSGGGRRDGIRSARLQRGSDDAVASLWRFLVGALAPETEGASADSTDEETLRIWGKGAPKCFLSHKAESKVLAKELKEELRTWGTAAFVAHEDIEPTTIWQLAIERALLTMDVFIGILTAGFAESVWTNQEVGAAVGRRIPVLAVKVDEDPRGFIARSQAIAGGGRTPAEIARAIISSMSGFPELTYPLQVGLVTQWEAVRTFEEGIRVMRLLDACKTVPPDLLERIESAYDANDQLHKSVGVYKMYPAFIERMKSGRRRR